LTISKLTTWKLLTVKMPLSKLPTIKMPTSTLPTVKMSTSKLPTEKWIDIQIAYPKLTWPSLINHLCRYVMLPGFQLTSEVGCQSGYSHLKCCKMLTFYWFCRQYDSRQCSALKRKTNWNIYVSYDRFLL
jgi:hypothetical protein